MTAAVSGPSVRRSPEPGDGGLELLVRQRDGLRVARVGGAGDAGGTGVVDHPGGQEAVRIEFTPLGAYRFFGRPMRMD